MNRLSIRLPPPSPPIGLYSPYISLMLRFENCRKTTNENCAGDGARRYMRVPLKFFAKVLSAVNRYRGWSGDRHALLFRGFLIILSNIS